MDILRIKAAVNAAVKCFDRLNACPGDNEISNWLDVDLFQTNWNLETDDLKEMLNKSFDPKNAIFRRSPYVLTGLENIFSNEADSQIAKRAFAKLFAASAVRPSQKLSAIIEFNDAINELVGKYSKNGKLYKWSLLHTMALLSSYDPANNYLYMITEVKRFFEYIDVDLKLGANAKFDIRGYYNVCEAIRTELLANQELQSLFAKIFAERIIKCDDKGHLQVFFLINAYKYPYFKEALHDSLYEIYAILLQKINEKEEVLKRAEAARAELPELPSLTGLAVEHKTKGHGIVTEVKIVSGKVNFIYVDYGNGEGPRPYTEESFGQFIEVKDKHYQEIKKIGENLDSQIADLKKEIKEIFQLEHK